MSRGRGGGIRARIRDGWRYRYGPISRASGMPSGACRLRRCWRSSRHSPGERGPFGIDQIAIDRQGAQAGGGVLHIGGKRTDLRVGGVEPARLHDAAFHSVRSISSGPAGRCGRWAWQEQNPSRWRGSKRFTRPVWRCRRSERSCRPRRWRPQAVADGLGLLSVGARRPNLRRGCCWSRWCSCRCARDAHDPLAAILRAPAPKLATAS